MRISDWSSDVCSPDLSELIADADTVQSAFRRNMFQSVTALLDAPSAFERFKDALTTNPTLTVDVKREPDYYAEQSKQLTQLLNFIAYFVRGIMAVGAMFGRPSSETPRVGKGSVR